MRKSYDTAFKVKVAVEAAKEQETLQELSARFEVSPGQISQWKRQLLEGAGELFERPNKKQKREREAEADRDRLLAKINGIPRSLSRSLRGTCIRTRRFPDWSYH